MSEKRTSQIMLIALWAIFFVFGLQLAGVGPLLGIFAEKLEVGVETIGLLFTAQSLAALLSAALIGPVLEKYNVRPVILIGVVAVTTGIVGMIAASSLAALLAAGAFIGFGVGFMDSGGQLLIIALYGDKSGRPLNSLHFVFSVGAVAGPYLAGIHGIAMLVLPVVVLALALPTLAWTIPGRINAGGGGEAGVNPWAVYRSPVLWMFGLLFLLYVGLEIGVGNWTTDYLARSVGMERTGGSEVTSLYWLSFMVSRLFVTAIGSRLTFERQLTLGISLALGGAILYAATVGTVAATTVATLVIGFGFGPVYPAAFAIVARTFSKAAGRASGVISMAGSIGAMILVPLQGVALERISPGAMTIYVAVLSAVMLGCYVYAVRGSNAHRAAVSAR